jgi:hypothetical protein
MGIFKHKQPAVIDLREQPPAPRRPRFEFGFPTQCSSCGDHGYLDHIDPFKRIQFEHCPSCFARWEHTEAEIAELNSISA